MRVARFAVVVSLCALVVVPSRPAANAPPPQAAAGYQQFLSPASPLEVVTARRVDRVAWVTFEEGKRNAYTAAAPAFAPVRLTNFMKDDGIDMSGVRISDDGSTVVFVRGTAPNRDGWVANPTADPNGPERAIWAVRTSGGPRVACRRGGGPRARARRELGAVRAGRADLPGEGDAGETCGRAGSRREAVHQGSGACRARRGGPPTGRRSRLSAPAPITASSPFTT